MNGTRGSKSVKVLYCMQELGHIPAAIIQHASLTQQKIARGLARDLPAMASLQQLTQPSIIVTGRVVNIAGSL